MNYLRTTEYSLFSLTLQVGVEPESQCQTVILTGKEEKKNRAQVRGRREER